LTSAHLTHLLFCEVSFPDLFRGMLLSFWKLRKKPAKIVFSRFKKAGLKKWIKGKIDFSKITLYNYSQVIFSEG
jgi:hypothetical protein